MFGESESESPRVPSPWDSLISSRSTSGSPPSSAPSCLNSGSHLSSAYPAPLTNTVHFPQQAVQIMLPRLVPEAESGNVEYKLQLLSPSPARFARLVTQLKWRLLEGGGQAYYELGVADSGALVGLNRTEMESSLETLEMMAGEIGASVVVVKEIEVPEAMVKAVKAQQEAGFDLNWVGEEKWGRAKKTRGRKVGDEGDETATTTSTTDVTDTTTTEATDAEDEQEDLSATVMLSRPILDARIPAPILTFTMDPEPEGDPGDNADEEREPDAAEVVVPSMVVDLEISSVFKPRPVRTRVHSAHLINAAGRNKRQKKAFKTPFKQGQQVQGEKKATDDPSLQNTTAMVQGHGKRKHRRQGKDRKKPTSVVLDDTAIRTSISLPVSETVLLSPAVLSEPSATTTAVVALATACGAQTGALISSLESLQVSTVEMNELGEDMLSVGLFMAPAPLTTSPSTKGPDKLDPAPFVIGEPKLEDGGDDGDDDDDVFPAVPNKLNKAEGDGRTSEFLRGDVEDNGKRIIVEVLVVRKMSLEEAFLDFGGAFAN